MSTASPVRISPFELKSFLAFAVYIIKTLKMCNEEDYFEYLRPCELNEKNELKYEYSEKFVIFLKDNNLYEILKIDDLILIYSS